MSSAHNTVKFAECFLCTNNGETRLKTKLSNDFAKKVLNTLDLLHFQ